MPNRLTGIQQIRNAVLSCDTPNLGRWIYKTSIRRDMGYRNQLRILEAPRQPQVIEEIAEPPVMLVMPPDARNGDRGIAYSSMSTPILTSQII